MDDLINTNKRLKTAHDNHERDYAAQIRKLDDSESKLTKRIDQLNEKKHEIAKTHGNVDAKDDDLVEINAGGKVVAAKRSTLTQLKGARFEGEYIWCGEHKNIVCMWCDVYIMFINVYITQITH